ncbi:MAG: hypothetical protein ACI36Z_10035 [Alloprevotella sp.]
MSNCKERNFELITSIKAYADKDLVVSDPMNSGMKFIDRSDLWIPESGGVEVPFDPKSATMSESNDTGLPGLSYECTIEFTLSEPNSLQYSKIDYLMDEHRDLIVETFGGNQFFVPTHPDTYDVEQWWNGKQLSVKISVTNVSGILQIL